MKSKGTRKYLPENVSADVTFEVKEVMWLALVCFVMLNSKFSKSLKGNEVKIDHSMIESLGKRSSPKIFLPWNFLNVLLLKICFNTTIF